MRRFFACAFVGLALLLAGCADKISPAEATLLGCESYSAALGTLAALREADKLTDGTVEIVDHVRATLNPLCLGPAPDVDASVKDIAIDAGVRTLQGILATVF